MANTTILFLVLSVICWGSGAFFDKLSLRHMDSFSTFCLRTLYITIGSILFLIWKYEPTVTALKSGSSKMASVFIVSSVIVTMAGVFFYLRAMSGGEASKIVPLTSVYPFVTFILVYLFLGESFTVNKFIGTFLISGGIYFISK